MSTENEASVEPTNRMKFAFNLNPPNGTSSISSMACDKECRRLAVGGSNILKLVEINLKDEKFSLKRNLKTTKTTIPIQNPVYVEWNPVDDNILAAGALGGSISLWDVNLGSGIKHNQVWIGHNQAINKLNWHPSDVNCLASGSHDCSVKSWDLRDITKPTATINMNSSVRDVKFTPIDGNMLVCALASGSIELFDRRNDSKKDSILTMDFNPSKPNLLVTGGAIDKQVKIWDINNLDKEVLKIKYHLGIGLVKWKPDDPNKLAISNYSFDNILSLWDTNQTYYPYGILRGHKEGVTTCVFEPKLNYIITAGRDGYVICHPLEEAYNPMHHCNKFGLTFDLDSTLAFTAYTPKQKVKSRKNISLVSKLNFFSGSKFNTLKEEIKYYSEGYQRVGDSLQDICEYNSEVSKDKKFVTKIWQDIPVALKEMTLEIYDQDNAPILSEPKAAKSFLGSGDLSLLISYYERHPDQFKSDCSERQITLKDGKIYIRPQYVKDVLKMIEVASTTSEKFGSKAQDLKRIERLTIESIIKTVQEMVNVGELQSAYFTYFVLHEKMPFPESLVKVWAQAYIELLRMYQFYQESNEIISSSPLQIISDGNKRSTTFLARCGKCRKISELDGSYTCSNCKDFISICSICKLPVKGLMLWCQVCGHGGHHKEIYNWFLTHTECPSGCNHKCFSIKNKNGVKALK